MYCENFGFLLSNIKCGHISIEFLKRWLNLSYIIARIGTIKIDKLPSTLNINSIKSNLIKIAIKIKLHL